MDFSFVHISKTGGETIEALLCIKKTHAPAKQRELKEYSFTFVRNPYTRLYSWYNHLRKHLYLNELETNELNNRSQCYRRLKRGMLMGPIPHRQLAVKYDFSQWVKILLKNKNDPKFSEPPYGPLGTQYNILYDDDGNLLVSDIFRFENYRDELSKLLTKLGKEHLIKKIQVTNASKNNIKVEDAYDDELKELVYEYFKKDFETFGYSKDSI